MIDLTALLPPVEIVQPEMVERRKRGSRRATRAAIGAVILLGDGTRCVVAGYDQQGRPLCYPQEEQ